MSGVNNFSWEGKARNHHVVPYYRPISEEKLAPNEKVTPSEDVEKGANLLDDMNNTKIAEKLDVPVRNDSVTQNKNWKPARDVFNDKEKNKD